MQQILFFYTFHFIVNACAALVFFSLGLLHLDSWQINKKNNKVLLRSIGFFLLSMQSIIDAASVDIPILLFSVQIIAAIGLILVLISLITEPLLSTLKEKGAGVWLVSTGATFVLFPVTSVLLLLIGIAYWRKSREGLERQTKLISVAFFVLAIEEFLDLSSHWANITNSPYWLKLFSDFGLVWNIDHLLELFGIILLAIWTWRYIRFRIRVQLFVVNLIMIMFCFLISTVLFIFFLLSNLEKNDLAGLQKNAKVLRSLLQTQQEKTIAQADTIARDVEIRQAFLSDNRKMLAALAENFLSDQKASTVVIASISGDVLARGEGTENTNDNVSDEYIFQQALAGNKVSTFVFQNAVPVSSLIVEAAVPINSNGQKIIGVVITGFVIDTAFVDKLKNSTQLDATIFGNDQRIATTFIAEDGMSRYVGTVEANALVLKNVLQDGKDYLTKEDILNKPYYSAYLPLKSADNNIVGMLFVGEQQDQLINSAKQAVDTTILGSIVLILISILPIYFFTKYLEKHVKA